MTFGLRDSEFMRIVSGITDSASAAFFCCTLGVFVLPLLLDRLVFYLPCLLRMTRSKEVQSISISQTITEIVLWIIILCATYTGLYYLRPTIFTMVSTSVVALCSWGITVINLIYRFLNFDRVIKRAFYYDAYLRYITPDALSAYKQFIADIDDLYAEKLDELLEDDLPYMHRQSVLRKRRQMAEDRKKGKK